MKKLLFVLPLLLLFACNQEPTVKIKGRIQKGDGITLYLDKLHTASAETIDSVKLDKDGDFRFKTKSTEPGFYLLRLSNGKLITLLANPDEKIEVNSISTHMSRAYTVSGSTGSALVKDLNDKLKETKDSIAVIRKQLEEKKSDINYSSISQNLIAKYVELIQDQREFSTNFIMKNATSLSSYLALYQKIDKNTYALNENSDIKFAKVVASSMRALYPEHEYTKAVLANLKEMEQNLTNFKLQKLIKEQGSNYPNLNLKNTEGKEVNLNSFNGKVIILSFWASQNPASRKLNRTLKKIYAKYKNKGLVIYHVSVDTNEKLWKQAIKQDDLNWTNVCEPTNGSSIALSTYNVKQIPANYIISKEGKFVGKNLYGLALEEKVADYIK
ncbi:TlpA disulfide reductase family protein [Ancylomarina sp. 16SWW S1-10-2]|uniref:TlpA disulfide reductase family protein n=1 Tax=Ancylomarina sp. 16SWW S1-10-2 TaxID=2499681 RepID=UPI0012ADE4E9|nr:TlpA disulfide reductase family protein [Ancylomarina sp. 16SWW S1-10-2]MRT91532.1 AhpC/TSA family protein [Ancylomarina sp. 16SWW S1-10-2]